jgi:hypothetical protein
VVYFKHNDMDSLQETLENITTKYKHTKNLRRYIVVEALYQVDLVYHACFYWLCTSILCFQSSADSLNISVE